MNKLLRTALAGIALALGLLFASSTPAAAAFTVNDGFESNVWTFQQIGTGSSAGLTTVGQRSGLRAAHLGGTSPSYALASRPMFIGTEDPACAASIWVDPLPSSVPTPVNFEIVDPANNQYIQLKTMTLSSSAGYTRINMAFVSPKPNVLVRVAVGTSVAGASVAANIDDFLLECH